ncbi:kinesin-like protein KIF21A isoform X2 [Anneissia japonica]|uniref:kinesin-like protein KIF21A isoform X2 n=1 Tax=Anneissia japonica TaxID=1529436 RepID=UPI0014257622|nr:kinesin-like protein KIF21A isoform X2 [Anneissia japonica]
MADDESAVSVAVRIRPQLAKEKISMCRVCVSITPGLPQVVLGPERMFTYDSVFSMDSTQESLYNSTVHRLIEGCFEGYNATVFAYGQTGSGKTYSMGTGFEQGITEEQQGIIPRAVRHLFMGIEARKTAAKERNEPPPEFKIYAEFMELYNEEIIDLFDTTRDIETTRNRKSHIRIHEDATGGIYVVGATTRPVTSEQDTLQALQAGALSRTTACTNMNAQSSRSHAIFTLHVKQQRLVNVNNNVENGEEISPAAPQTDSPDNVGLHEFETLTAKFHFVDLAGSERLKRTGATGDRAKEGISINCGLLALGNVISALGDRSKKATHVPYRDSKLTRLLQDSLGGNSRTLMIACVSPSDPDFMETLNTLRYANRARNIKNKVVANQDKTSRQLAALRAEIRMLQDELMEYKQGKRQLNADGVEEINDLFHENTMLQTEINKLRERVRAMQETIDAMSSRIALMMADQARFQLNNITNSEGEDDGITSMIQNYLQEIEDLRAKLIQSETMMTNMKRRADSSLSHSTKSPSRLSTAWSMHPHVSDSRHEYNDPLDCSVQQVIAVARKQLEHDQEKLRQVEEASSHQKQRHLSGSHGHSDAEPLEAEMEVTNDVALHQTGEDEENDEDDAKEMSGDSDLDEDEDEDDDEEDEQEQAEVKLQEDLAEIACEITVKQKLIEELEMSQRRLHTLKVQYEEKLNTLLDRIKETEKERDDVLTNLGSMTESRTQEKAAKIKAEYEIKLKKLAKEKDRLLKGQKEHSRLLRNKTQYEKQMRSLQTDLAEMKKLKVKLMKQIREEQQNSRLREGKSNREIQQLKKSERKKENLIKNLEAKARTREIVLKRRQEELSMLRKQKRPMSDKAAGRLRTARTVSAQNGKVSGMDSKESTKLPVSMSGPRRHTRKGTSQYSSKVARTKWQNVERKISNVVTRKQTVSHMESDMERFLRHRQKLDKKLDKYTTKRDDAVRDGKDPKEVQDLTDQIGTVQANIDYVQEQISECQSNIMEMMENRDDGETQVISDVIESCNLLEAKYLLEHFLTLSINTGLVAAQRESTIRELDAKLHQVEQNSFVQQQLLQHVISDQQGMDIEVEGLFTQPEAYGTSSSESSRASSPVDSSTSSQNVLPVINNGLPPTDVPLQPTKVKDKARRRTATQEELLYAGQKDNPDATPLITLPEKVLSSPDDNSSASDSAIMPPPRTVPTKRDSFGKSDKSSSATRSLASRRQSNEGMPTRSGHADASPAIRRKGIPQPQVINTVSTETVPIITPPGSPPQTRRSSEQNVFSRLYAQTSSPAQGTVDRLGIEHGVQRMCGRSSPTPTTQSKSPPFDAHSCAARLVQRAASPTPRAASPTPRSAQVVEQHLCSARLSQRAGSPTPPAAEKGSINPVSVTNKPQGQKAPLICSYTAEGHTKAVLSVQATEDMLFSGSKDRTVKVWNLETGQELLTLGGHPNNVISVHYCKNLQLVFSVSTSYIKVWDIRENSGKCIKTLSSSGLVTTNNVATSSTRSVAVPTGENLINDIAINSAGTQLYSAASNIVRVWDLNSFQATCKLSGGHSAAVMCIGVEAQENNSNMIITGSKDHYIKLFEVPEGASGLITPKHNLDPPHFDGVQSLAVSGSCLFSGSRDTCIKKWDLEKQILQKSVHAAHKDWICALDFLPGKDCLLSGCRGGQLKLWNINDCSQIGEMKAHSSPINSIATNSTHVFTASSNIKAWRILSPRNGSLGHWQTIANLNRPCSCISFCRHKKNYLSI